MFQGDGRGGNEILLRLLRRKASYVDHKNFSVGDFQHTACVLFVFRMMKAFRFDEISDHDQFFLRDAAGEELFFDGSGNGQSSGVQRGAEAVDPGMTAPAFDISDSGHVDAFDAGNLHQPGDSGDEASGVQVNQIRFASADFLYDRPDGPGLAHGEIHQAAGDSALFERRAKRSVLKEKHGKGNIAVGRKGVHEFEQENLASAEFSVSDGNQNFHDERFLLPEKNSVCERFMRFPSFFRVRELKTIRGIYTGKIQNTRENCGHSQLFRYFHEGG